MRGRAPSSLAQVGHLVALRWASATPARRVLAVAAGLASLLLGPAALWAGASTGPRLSSEHRLTLVEVGGGSLLLVAVGIVVAAVASSGGRELIPSHHLVAYPVRPSTEHLLTLALAPANLAWVVQVAGLFMVTGVAYSFEHPGPSEVSAAGLGLAGLVVTAWVAAWTAAAAVLAWLVEFVRTLPGGRWVIRGGLVALAVLVVRGTNAETLSALLDLSWTRAVFNAAVDADDTGAGAALAAAAILSAATAAFLASGTYVYARLRRRPTREQSRSETATHRPRQLPDAGRPLDDVRVWMRQDRALVWRCVPLRRGLLVLLIGPAAGGLLAEVAWEDLTLITAVIASGAGLLFGVNSFALDGEGAIWRQTLPVPPRTWIVARAGVLAQITVGLSLLATAATALSASGHAHPAAMVAVVVAIPAMSAHVVAQCLRWSVRYPERAELRTTRDSPASPGRMVRYSLQLVAVTTAVAVGLAMTARIGHPLLPLMVGLVPMMFAALSIRDSMRIFDEPIVRARLVQRVARG